jgi:hypothetical protein
MFGTVTEPEGPHAPRITAVTVAGRPARPRRWPAVLAWALWALAVLGIAAVLWFDHLLRQAGRAGLVQLNASGLPWLLALVSAPTVGAVLAARRTRHPVGWLLLGLGASIGLSAFADGYSPYGLLARPGSLPAARWAAIYSPAVTVACIACLSFVLLLTPTGSLPSPRWRWWARVAAAAPVVFLVALTLEPQPLEPAYRSVTNPLGLRALQAPSRSPTSLPAGSPSPQSWSGRCRWWCASGAPAAPSASNCAGWRWRRCWCRWRSWWCWPAWSSAASC